MSFSTLSNQTISNSLPFESFVLSALAEKAIECDDFSQLKTLCLFIGYSRSGHTLVSSFIDAHPNAMMANEVDVFAHADQFNSSEELFAVLCKSARDFNRTHRQWGPHKYKISSQWHGRYKKLLLIGDKKAAGSLNCLSQSSDALKKIRAIAALDLKVIHLIRNPFDNINSIAKFFFNGEPHHIQMAIDTYFKLANLQRSAREAIGPENVLDLYFEDLGNDPDKFLKTLFNFINLETSEKHIDACKGAITMSPISAESLKKWTNPQIEFVQSEISKRLYLRRYKEF